MTASIAFSTSRQLDFLMGVSRTPGAALSHDRPRPIQQPHTVQCDGSDDQYSENYQYLFHEPTFYTNDVQGS